MSYFCGECLEISIRIRLGSSFASEMLILIRPHSEIRMNKNESCDLLSSTEIFCLLQKKFPAAFRNSNVINMGRMLVSLGVERVHTRNGSAYRVIPM